MIPLEVKAGAAGSLKSLHQFVNKYQSDLALKVTQENVELKKVQANIPQKDSAFSFVLLNVPFYVLWHLAEFLQIERQDFKNF